MIKQDIASDFVQANLTGCICIGNTTTIFLRIRSYRAESLRVFDVPHVPAVAVASNW